MRLVLLIAAVICLSFDTSESAELELNIAGFKDNSATIRQPDSSLKIRVGETQGGKSIHWMAFTGDERGVDQAIISGDGVNDRVENGNTPLHIAAYKGHTKVARLLIEHGARVNARTKNGITPLDWAQRNGHKEVATLLLSHGAKTTEDARSRSSGKDLADWHKGNKEKPIRSIPATGRKPLNHTLLPFSESSITAVNRPFEGDRRTEKPILRASYRIQLGAFSSKRRAQDAWNAYKKRCPESLGSRELILDPVTAKEKTYHRVQAGPMSRHDAKAICDELKKANQDCFIMKHEP